PGHATALLRRFAPQSAEPARDAPEQYPGGMGDRLQRLAQLLGGALRPAADARCDTGQRLTGAADRALGAMRYSLPQLHVRFSVAQERRCAGSAFPGPDYRVTTRLRRARRPRCELFFRPPKPFAGRRTHPLYAPVAVIAPPLSAARAVHLVPPFVLHHASS